MMETTGGSNLPTDMKQLMFNNLQLLGLDAQAMEASIHIPFNKLMFDLPNKRGAEIILHFLFQRLNPTMCKEEFRHCWPIHNKQTEQSFRKVCANWLISIVRDEPDSHLPRINASLFMSPGGEKFYQLLFYFSGYVLQKTLEKDLGINCSEVKYPAIKSQSLQLGEVMMKNSVCKSVRHRNGFFSTAPLTLMANNSWRETVDELVKKNRKLSKELREVEYKIREEEQVAAQTAQSRGSPIKSRGDVDQFDPNFDPRIIKRAQKIQKVRDMWKQLDDFEHSDAAEREVIESIVENTLHKHKIDAAHISIKVPDMLLRECAEEIRRRNIDNTYQRGKLNLVSVLQLWNLCIQLYLEKLQQVGVPKFGDEVKKLESQCHTQQNYLRNAQALGEEMQKRLPELKFSVKSLRERLNEMFSKGMTPTSVRSTSLGYSLVEPSPQMSFSPEHGRTPAGGIGIPRDVQQVETPDAVAVIAQEVESRVRQARTQLFNDIELQLNPQPEDGNNSAIPKPHKKPSHGSSSKTTSIKTSSSKASSRASSRQSTPSTSFSSSRGGKKTQKPTTKSSPRVEMESFLTVSSPRTMVQSVTSALDSPKAERPDLESQHSPSADRDGGRLSPSDFLVEEIMGEAEVLNTCTSGLEAFKSRDRVVRTPDLIEENKENIQPHETEDNRLGRSKLVETSDDTVLGNKIEDEINLEVEEDDQDRLTYEDIYRLDSELSVRQRDISEIPVPELEGEYDNEISEENLLVIDRSFSALQGEEGVDNRRSFGSPSTRQNDSQGSSPRPIVIDKSIHLSPMRNDHKENTDKKAKVSAKYQPVSPSTAGSQLSTTTKSCVIPGSPARKDEIIRQKLANTVRSPLGKMGSPLGQMGSPLGKGRSPLSEEIRKMFREAVADLTPTDPTQTPTLQKSLSGCSRSSFSDQVQLEALVVGENIGRRDSEYLSRSGHLAQSFQQLNSERTQSPVVTQVDDILRRVKAMEESMFGRGTPLGYSSDLELPVMDPNSRIPDSDNEYGSGLKKGDISWELTENLEDIEMPDLDLDQDMDDEDGDCLAGKELTNKTENDIKFDLNFKPVDLEEFFESKTPEPKRRFEMQAESLQSTDSSNVPLPKFPQLPPEDDSPLISFTP